MLQSVQMVKSELKHLRSDEFFSTVYKQAEKQIDALDLSPTLTPRKGKMPSRYVTDTVQCESNTVKDLYSARFFKHSMKQWKASSFTSLRLTLKIVESYLLCYWKIKFQIMTLFKLLLRNILSWLLPSKQNWASIKTTSPWEECWWAWKDFPIHGK